MRMILILRDFDYINRQKKLASQYFRCRHGGHMPEENIPGSKMT